MWFLLSEEEVLPRSLPDLGLFSAARALVARAWNGDVAFHPNSLLLSVCVVLRPCL